MENHNVVFLFFSLHCESWSCLEQDKHAPAYRSMTQAQTEAPQRITLKEARRGKVYR